MAKVKKLLSKFLAGEFSELHHRLRSEIYTWQERNHYRRQKSLFDPIHSPGILHDSFLAKYSVQGKLHLAAALREAEYSRFYPGFSQIQRFRNFLEPGISQEIARIISAADSILADQFPIFKESRLSYESPPRWNYDPLAGKTASDGFYTDINYLDAAFAGDSKVIWEVSRLQFVFDLGQAYILTGEEKYPQKFFDLIRSWCEYHRDYHGIAFCSALEFAFRINSVLWGIHFFKDSSSLREKNAFDLYRLIYISAAFIEKHLSRYFAPNTHLLGEAWGLYMVGLFFPEFRDAGRWLHIGKQILTDELENQFTPDGMHAELSVAYHAYALEFILSATILSERKGDPLPRRFYERINQMTEVLASIRRPDGKWPNIGDQDGGRLHFLSRAHGLDYGPLLETARLFTLNPAAIQCFGTYVDSFWLNGAEPDQQNITKAEAGPSRYFPGAGLAVFRSDREMFSLFQCGKFGYKDSPHSHADMLQLDISVGRDNFLVDPGTYVYSGNLKLRNDYRSAKRHNGPAFESVLLHHPEDPFAWLQQPDCSVAHCYLGERSDFIAASYNLSHPHTGAAKVQRSILFVHDGLWVVRDRIEMSRPCRASWRFTSPFQIDETMESYLLRGSSGILALLCDFNATEVTKTLNNDSSISEDYVHRQTAFALNLETEPADRIEAIFLLVPLKISEEAAFTPNVMNTGKATVISYNRGCSQFVLTSRKCVEERCGLQTDADLAVLTREQNGSLSCVLLNGSSLFLDNKKVFQAASAVEYAVVRMSEQGASIETSNDVSCFLHQSLSVNSIIIKNLAS